MELLSLYPPLDQINAACVAIYLAGRYDIFTRDVFLLYRNLTVPKRCCTAARPQPDRRIAPDLYYGAEVQRWFDHWLKSIDTGSRTSPPSATTCSAIFAEQARVTDVADLSKMKDDAKRPRPGGIGARVAEGVGGAAGDEDGGHAVDVSAISPPDDVADDKRRIPL